MNTITLKLTPVQLDTILSSTIGSYSMLEYSPVFKPLTREELEFIDSQLSVYSNVIELIAKDFEEYLKSCTTCPKIEDVPENLQPSATAYHWLCNHGL